MSDAPARLMPPAPEKPSQSAPVARPQEMRFASLSASLLARKGEAEPALEPFAHARVADSAREMRPGDRHDLSRADARDAGAPPVADCPRRRAASGGKRAAVTFRMSVHDFLRLQLASAELERPTQDIIIDALKAYLDAEGVESLADCKCLSRAGACAAPVPPQQTVRQAAE